MAKLPRNATRAIIAAVIAAIVIVGGYLVLFSGGSDKKITARFATAIGVYKGTPVRILGVNVGHVTGVHPGPRYVSVTMTYSSKYKLAKNAAAVEVANSLVSDRYIQLTPLYDASHDKGGYLTSGAIIPTSRTQGPAELDDIYAALNKLAVALGPSGVNQGGKTSGAFSTLLKVAAANLKGNGAALGQSITKLSEAAQTLANQRSNLFGTVRNLQKFTQALQGSDQQIRLFNQQLAQVASDLASERSDLGAALHDLGLALDDVSGFIKNNQGRFHTDIQGLREITQLLVNQKSSLTETLAVAPVALANVVHAWQPDIGAIATRSNLASLTSLNNNSPVNILCSVLQVAVPKLPGCPSHAGTGGLGAAIANPNQAAGLGIPGLIGAGS